MKVISVLILSACGITNSNRNETHAAKNTDTTTNSDELKLAGGRIVANDDGSVENPMGYTVLFGFTDNKQTSGNGQPCTGTLINKRVVLTAAHCLVKVGDEVISEAGGKISEYKAQKVITHESYKPSEDLTYAPADFALVLLDRDTMGRPLELADKAPTAGSTVKVSGYGLSQNTIAEIKAYKKMYGEEPIKDDVNLRTGTMKIEKVEPSAQKELAGMAAITLTKGSAMTCKGDSGGGLVVKGRLAGVLAGGGRVSVNGGVSCNEKFYKDGYSVFGSIAHQIDWIRNALNELMKYSEQMETMKSLGVPETCSLQLIRPAVNEVIDVFRVTGYVACLPSGCSDVKTSAQFHTWYSLQPDGTFPQRKLIITRSEERVMCTKPGARPFDPPIPLCKVQYYDFNMSENFPMISRNFSPFAIYCKHGTYKPVKN